MDPRLKAPLIEVVALPDHPVFVGHIKVPERKALLLFDHHNQCRSYRFAAGSALEPFLDVATRTELERSLWHRDHHAGRDDALSIYGSDSGAVRAAISNGARWYALRSPRSERELIAHEYSERLSRATCRDGDCDGRRHVGLLFVRGAPAIGAAPRDAVAFTWHVGFGPFRVVPPDPIVLYNR